MDLSIITDNWEILTTIGTAIGGSYVVKVKVAVKSLQNTIKDGQEVIAAGEAALEDGVITKEEVQKQSEEIQEFLYSLHESAQKVSSILPGSVRKHVPLKFQKPRAKNA